MVLRFGLIGYGAWGSYHAAAIAKTPGATLVAIAARSPESLAKAKAAHPAVALTDDYHTVLRRPDVDIVSIVLPNALHEAAAVAALEAGKHVLLEKPMATSVAGCDRILAAAQQAGRMLNIAHEFRVSSQWRQLKSYIDDGRLGTPMYLLINLWRRPFRSGSQNWRYDAAQVGSWLLEEPTHFVDLATWYFSSLGQPVSVVAASNSKDRGPGMCDNVSMLLRWAGGQYAVISQTLAGFAHHKTVELVGTRGAVRAQWSGAMDRTASATATLHLLDGLTGAERFDIGTPQEVALAGPSGEIYELEEQLCRVVESVQTGQPYVSGTEGRRAVAICLTAEQAAREQRELPLHL
jgi:myo-inositol 2-dehydrogenase/D-chiro-inositol 1-dehydrogenase